MVEQGGGLSRVPKWLLWCGLCNNYKVASVDLFFWISWVDLNQRITRMLPTLRHYKF
ncbi:hypothetical protein Pan161_10340 [Gimesia algae]|uniref:Uncharacterized protein n=1 Tax=Gimesia algae TaxID=2527971 RepID=A0A517V8R8_9PLAN|nr:hypothetical protein Pan161_10340 [Gimesia algae]